MISDRVPLPKLECFVVYELKLLAAELEPPEVDRLLHFKATSLTVHPITFHSVALWFMGDNQYDLKEWRQKLDRKR